MLVCPSVALSQLVQYVTGEQTWDTDTDECADDPYCLAGQWSKVKVTPRSTVYYDWNDR